MEDVFQKQIDLNFLLKIQGELTKKIQDDLIKNIEDITEFKETYDLIQKLSLINGFGVNKKLLDRVMFNSETLPRLGKEYWWFLFIGRNGEKPIQLMFLIFRKHGESMLFNDKKMALKKINKNKFLAVTTGWVWDGEKVVDLGDTNAITTINSKKKTLISTILNQKVTFKGGFPNSELKIGDNIKLNMSALKQFNNKDAFGESLLPFGIGQVDIFTTTTGTIFGKKFSGSGQLQKVFGISPFGLHFNWGKILFQNGSSLSFLGIKLDKNSEYLFREDFSFYDHKNSAIIKFKKPKLKIVKKEDKKKSAWIISGYERDKEFSLVLETYMGKQFIMKNRGWQSYHEYGVLVKEFNLKTKDEKISLKDLGRGIGTFEDAYGSMI